MDHPDIMDFIRAKTEDSALENFNLSVMVIDSFMEAVEKDEAYDLIDPETQPPSECLRAREVFDEAVRAAWETGDPGLIFYDGVNRAPTLRLKSDPWRPPIQVTARDRPLFDQPQRIDFVRELKGKGIGGRGMPRPKFAATKHPGPTSPRIICR